jgi:hypothetical protein
MTETEAKMLLTRSPSLTAAKLALYLPSTAERLVHDWIRVLASFKTLPVPALAFWVTVARRLKGYKPGAWHVTAHEKAQFDSMLSYLKGPK